jgi:hypothetical protein
MNHAVVVFAAALLGLGTLNCAQGALVTISLGTPVEAGTGIDVPVTIAFGGSPGDTLYLVNLAFYESLLSNNGTSFSDFSFTTTLPGWDDSFTLGVGPALDPMTGVVLLSSSDSSFDLQNNSTTQLGVLHLDLGLSGFPSGTQLHITLDGADPAFPTDAFGDINGASTFISDLGPGSIETQPTDFTITPEPSSLALFSGLVLAGIMRTRWRRRRQLAA